MPSSLKFNWRELQQITAGCWSSHNGRNLKNGVTAICDDSRTLSANALFVAVKGTLADGHNFVEQAVANGAAAVCVEPRRMTVSQEDAVRRVGVPILEVENTLFAYHALARVWRRRCPRATVIGITGTSGKTSLRAILEAIMRAAYGQERVLATHGNMNNQFGVPRNLLRMSTQHRVAVIEMGTNQPGEIARLAAMVEPDIAVITTIGRGHLECFGTVEAVGREKAALLSALPSTGIGILRDKCPARDQLLQAVGNRRVLLFGPSEDADVQVRYAGVTGNSMYHLDFSGPVPDLPRQVEWPVGGRHQAINAAAAVATAKAMGIASEEIVAGLQGAQLPDMRMQRVEKHQCHWVNDAYNANPDSMRAAIDWFAELAGNAPAAAKWLVLGDMLELGDSARKEHVATLEWVRRRLPAANILPTGQHMQCAAQQIGLRGFPGAAAVAEELYERIEPGDWILLKGSRGVKLEKILHEYASSTCQ